MLSYNIMQVIVGLVRWTWTGPFSCPYLSTGPSQFLCKVTEQSPQQCAVKRFQTIFPVGVYFATLKIRGLPMCVKGCHSTKHIYFRWVIINITQAVHVSLPNSVSRAFCPLWYVLLFVAKECSKESWPKVDCKWMNMTENLISNVLLQ